MANTDMDTTPRADIVQKRPPLKNTARERMKAEIEMLREELVKLEASKRRLYKPKRKRMMISMEGAADASGVLAAADREEHKKRRAAEQENKQLRRALSRQLQAVKKMMAALYANALLDLVWAALDNQPSLSSVLNDDYGYRFAALADSAGHYYRRFDELAYLGSYDAHAVQLTTTLTAGNVGGQERLMLEGRETTVIPYDFDLCHGAMWKAIKTSSWGEGSKVVVHASTADSVMVRVFSSHTVRGELVGMTVSRVIRRFVEDDRVIFVWRAVSSLDGHELDSDVYVDETGWCAMLRVSEADKEDVVVKKICSQWSPQSFSQCDDRKIAAHPGTTAFTDLMLASAVGDAMKINDSMETFLIDDCMPS